MTRPAVTAGIAALTEENDARTAVILRQSEAEQFFRSARLVNLEAGAAFV
jgi:hypothetical protein